MASTNGLPPGGDEDRATGFVICVSITTIAALLVVALRIYVRTRIIRAVGRDDWAILLAMVIPPADRSILSLTGNSGLRITSVDLCVSGSRLWLWPTRILSYPKSTDEFDQVQCPCNDCSCSEHLLLQDIRLPICVASIERCDRDEAQIVLVHLYRGSFRRQCARRHQSCRPVYSH